MRILLSAYSCEPGRGSEPEVGLRALLAATADHEVWVLTRENNLPPLEAHLRDHPARPRIHLVGHEVGPALRRVKRLGLPGLHVYYDGWQRSVATVAEALHREHGFDLVHHVTFAAHWTRVGVAGTGPPLVWGPVGGAVTTPPGLASVLGWRGLLEDASRMLTRRLVSATPDHRRTIRTAAVTIAQNRETAARLAGARDVMVYPNGAAVDIDGAPAGEPRGTDIVAVGRLVPWKGLPLALRALRHVRHPTRLVIIGDGPERGRLERLARRWGVAGRVCFRGQVPRDEVLAEIARAGVVVSPALHEEGGVAVGEVLALGTPLVCLDRGGPADQITRTPGARAIAVRPSSPGRTSRALAAALDAQLADPAPPADRIHPPSVTFAEALRDAYARAIAAPQ